MKKTTLQICRLLPATLLLLIVALSTDPVQAQGWSFISGNGLETTVRTGMRLPTGDLIALSNNLQPDGSRGYSFTRVFPDQAIGGYPAQGFEWYRVACGLAAADTNYIHVLEEYAQNDQQRPGLRLARFERTHMPPNFVYAPTFTVLVAPDATRLHGGDVCATPDGDFIVTYSATADSSATEYDVVLSRHNPNGMTVWNVAFAHPDYNLAVDVEPSGSGYALLIADSSTVTGQWNGRLVLTDASGQALNTATFGAGYQPAQLRVLANGDLAVTGTYRSGNGPGVMFARRYDPAGQLLWQRDDLGPNGAVTRGTALTERFDGELLILGSQFFPAINTNKMLTIRLSADGTSVTSRRTYPVSSPTNRDYEPRYLIPDDEGGFIAALNLVGLPNLGNSISLLLRADAAGIVYGGLIRGSVRRDTDNNCQPSPAEPALAGWTVEAAGVDRVFFTTVQPDGTYEMAVDSGEYTVHVHTPASVWDPCLDSMAVYAAYLDTATVEFAVQALTDCPVMTVDLGVGQLRQCSAAVYSVLYRNVGSAAANDAYIEVTIDSLLTVTGSSVPWTNVQGHTYTFELGNLAVGAQGWFTIDVQVPCDVDLLGVTHCSEAHAYPDMPCLAPNPLWSGARVAVEAECRDTAVVFRLRNVGAGNMGQPLNYVIIEDAVLMMQGEFQLNSGQFQEFSVPNDGASYYLAADQEPYAPGASRPLLSLEGCVAEPGSPASLGYVLPFPHDENDDFLAVACGENVGAYDPNDKIGYPTGVGAAHTIAAGEEIDYVVRFQNTGTDTAFKVVILDELSPELDPATLRPGAASHPYTFELLADGLARFQFEPIALPDSATNAAASQGFVQFRVAQKPGLAPGTQIKNTAGIVFDLNPAIVTNTTLHTIGMPFTTAVIDRPGGTGTVPVQIAPNPFTDVARFELSGADPAAPAVLRVFDTAGRTLRSIEFEGRAVWFHRDGLPAGLFFFVIEAGGRRLASGRLLAE